MEITNEMKLNSTKKRIFIGFPHFVLIRSLTITPANQTNTTRNKKDSENK